MTNILFLLSDATHKEQICIEKDDGEEIIVGGMILNRIVGIAYNRLNLDDFNKESVKILSQIKKYYNEKSKEFLEKLNFIVKIMANADFAHAFLKGAVLISSIYEPGQRIANDIDLLIHPDDTSRAHNLLTNNGFVQGHCDKNNNIIPASRKEIIESKMCFGETVPYLKKINNSIIEVDVNFSVDYKSKGNKNTVANMLAKCELQTLGSGLPMKTLAKDDFIIHLCCHLYKEATTYDWLINRRDLMLYKFADINILISKYYSEDFLKKLQMRIIELETERECYYTFFNAMIIYPRLRDYSRFVTLLNNIRPATLDYMHEIVNPRNNKCYYYDCSFEEWFNCPNRILLLKEKFS